MSIEISLNTPLADALTSVIQPKLMEVGWAQSNDDAALSEYIILMLVNGKTQEQIAGELAGDLLSLGPDDPAARDFTHWLFDQINSLQSQLNDGVAQAGIAAGDAAQGDAAPMEQDTEMSTSTDGPELNAPTGPKSMRNGNMRGGREKRLFGQMAKAMDRSHDSVLHRVRTNGNERINAHNRAPPTGPRLGRGNNRMMNNRAASITAGLNQMVGGMAGIPGAPNMNNGMNGMNGMTDMSWMMQGGPQQEQIFQLLQQQNQMMTQLQQQLTQQNQGGNGRPGRSLFDRTQNPRGGRRGGHHQNGPRSQRIGSPKSTDNNVEGEDVDMSQAKPEPPNPETTMCKFNLACTNKDCKFAHQSPAAPPNTTVDVSDVCSFGAACKNWKCVGRHPSPATKRAHQNEQECKFYPNCTNPHCPFKHPDMPPCRNGGDCNVEGCKFTHIQTMCKFKPCKNRYCPFKHEEGQRGTFPDKVWTADGAKNHVSERQFVDQNGDFNACACVVLEPRRCVGAMMSQRREDVFINLLRSFYNNAQHPALRLTARRPALVSQPGSTRHLSALCRLKRRPWPPIGCRRACASSEAVHDGPKQQYATSATGPDPTKPREIAVLGAGITGLTAAHYLSRYTRNANITIYEASDGPGGWIKANRVEVEDAEGQRGHVLFQNGPRMLRSGSTSTKYDDLVLYDVLAGLNMGDQIRHPEAVSGNRYLYYPDRLVKMPSGEPTLDNIVATIRSYLTEPIWSGGLRALYNFWVSYNKALNPYDKRDTGIEVPEDESVAQFLTRILKDDRIVKNVVSGVMHGIYGGDINKLSAKHTILEHLWHSFRKPLPPDSGLSWMNKADTFLLADMMSSINRLKIIELADSAVDWKLLAFKDGLISLVKGLEKDLKVRSHVTIKYGEPVTSLKHENAKILVTTPKTKHPIQYDHVICTLFSKQLAQITEPPNSLPSLAETHAVTIMVVNLWYPNPNLLAEGGFGYLIPSSTPDNDEGALGVLFDSDLRTDDSEMPGTKLTVMLGGHHWDGWMHFPSEEVGIAMAKEVVRRQLGISDKEKVVAGARLCRDCLPQHFVGHRDRMRAAHYELLSAFQGHLTVAGPSYTTIGVIPAMRAGFDAGMRVARGHAQPWFHIPTENPVVLEWDFWFEAMTRYEEITDTIGASGLEQFAEKEDLEPGDRSYMLFRKFTKQVLRFHNTDGQFLDVDQRRFKNAPPRQKNPFNLKEENEAQFANM
ncbi:hypothetical protein F5Y09DRAFT_328819 [Xylaria sp. FL1042]|nr:hypothetical protein F5Y09DRAFT_328819 [Xylaria sp. FL1042]